MSVKQQELEVRSLNYLYSLKTKNSRCHYVVMTRSETKLSVAIPAPVSGQSAVNVATATSKCSITFLLPYDQDGDVKIKQDNCSRAQSGLATIWLNIYIYILFAVLVDVGMKRISLH